MNKCKEHRKNVKWRCGLCKRPLCEDCQSASFKYKVYCNDCIDIVTEEEEKKEELIKDKTFLQKLSISFKETVTSPFLLLIGIVSSAFLLRILRWNITIFSSLLFYIFNVITTGYLIQLIYCKINNKNDKAYALYFIFHKWKKYLIFILSYCLLSLPIKVGILVIFLSISGMLGSVLLELFFTIFGFFIIAFLIICNIFISILSIFFYREFLLGQKDVKDSLHSAIDAILDISADKICVILFFHIVFACTYFGLKHLYFKVFGIQYSHIFLYLVIYSIPLGFISVIYNIYWNLYYIENTDNKSVYQLSFSNSQGCCR